MRIFDPDTESSSGTTIVTWELRLCLKGSKIRIYFDLSLHRFVCVRRGALFNITDVHHTISADRQTSNSAADLKCLNKRSVSKNSINTGLDSWIEFDRSALHRLGKITLLLPTKTKQSSLSTLYEKKISHCLWYFMSWAQMYREW